MAGIPTEWTFGGEVDWSSEDTIKLRDSEYLFKPIFEAIKECDNITGRPVPTLISNEYNPLLPKKNYIAAIQAEISILITQFSDHVDNGGDWTGETDQSNVAPYWNTSVGDPHNILQYCDTTTRLTASNPYTLPAWFRQQYQLLNLLRFLKIESIPHSRFVPFDSMVQYYKDTVYARDMDRATSYAAALAIFQANAWQETTIPSSYWEYIGSEQLENFPDPWSGPGWSSWVGEGFPGRSDPPARYMKHVFNNPTDFDYDFDFYVKLAKPPYHDAYYSMFEDFAEGVFNIKSSGSVSSGGTQESNVEPNDPPQPAISTVGSMVDKNLAVLKFNSRKFKDW